MATKKVKEVVAGLKNKGFSCREGNHQFFHLLVGGKKTTVWTKISHGKKELNDNLLALMSRQVKLTRSDFDDLINCPLTSEEYLRILRDRKCIE